MTNENQRLTELLQTTREEFAAVKAMQAGLQRSLDELKKASEKHDVTRVEQIRSEAKLAEFEKRISEIEGSIRWIVRAIITLVVAAVGKMVIDGRV